ncbi:MAG TPA: hypothetical protein DHW02_15070 [Ktedonobacter sp.]|nr:hypothetical protein [Ktedonobacter sp.]
MSLHFQETLVDGGSPLDFPIVRHLILSGSNYEIGKQLAEIVIERYGNSKRPSGDPRIIQARHLYFQQHYPILLERTRGVANAFGINLDTNTADLASLMYPSLQLPQMVGCSVIFYPPETTANGHGLLSRNCDAQTESMLEMLNIPVPHGITLKPTYSEPYIMEMYPDVGYPSLYLACMDLLGACFDGINSEGLTVSLMADGDPNNMSLTNPTQLFRVGINELQILRLLLDTCASVEEAQQALLLNKHYHVMLSCHYIVADRYGKSFVWEHAYGHNMEYIIEGKGVPQIVTNHPLHLASSQEASPEKHENAPIMCRADSFARYQTLKQAIASYSGMYSVDFLKETNACVFADDAMQQEYIAATGRELLSDVRTLWHSIYDTQERSLEVSFYLRDEPSADEASPRTAIRSTYHRFQLNAV